MKSFLYKLATQTAVTATMLLLVFAPFQTLIAEAQSTSVFDAGSGTNINNTGPAVANSPTTNNGPSTISTVNSVTNPSSVSTPANTAAQQVSNQNNPSTSDLFGACSLNPTKFDASGCIGAVIYAFTIGIGSVFAYVAAYFFDITIQLSLNGASYGLDFISTSWTTARDLGNMAFLFILLYIAFTIIFKAETGQTKTMLAIVIVVALLVNFSFFFTRIVIDAGNILSIQFYNAIPAPPISQTIQGASPAASAVSSVSQTIGGSAGGTKDLTAGIMNMLNIQGLLNNNSFAATNGNFVAKIIIYIAGAIVLWLLTIAFITNGIKFLVRVVVLWFLIIASPLALISIAVQGTGGYFKQWRELLLQHAFYPVAFMFVFLVLNNFATTMASSNTLTGGVFTTVQTTGASSYGAIGASLVALGIRLALVIAVLYIGMKASDTISVKGSKAAGTAGGWIGGKFFGTYGAMGRNTFGWAANKASQNASFQSAAANNSFVRTLWRGTNTLAKSSFDVRGALKAAGVKDVAGVSTTLKNKDGYKGKIDARVKAHEEEAKKFGGLSDAQKAEAKVVAESKYAASNASITAQTASATASLNEADRQQKEAQIRLQAAKETEAEFTVQEQAAKKEYDAAVEREKDAERAIQDHRDNGKIGTPEMVAAQKQRDEAHENVAKAKAKITEVENSKTPHTQNREAVEKDVKDHATAKQELNSKIQDLAKQRTAIKADIEKETKAEEKRREPKNKFADSIEGKNGWAGNLSRLGMWIPAGDKKAADKIRKGKDNKEKLKDLVKDMEKEDSGKEEKKDEPAAAPKEDKKDDHH